MRKALSALTGWWCRSSLVVRILIGLFAGAVLGLTVPDARGISILGTVFVGALKAIAPVLVAVLVASALSRAHSHMGARFRTVILLYLLTTALAAVVAVAASFLFPVEIRLQGVAGGSLLLIPMACSLFGISNDIAMQAVAVGFIIGVVQDSVETMLNSSSDAMFTATAEWYDKKRGEEAD